jgi:hypothetical protein
MNLEHHAQADIDWSAKRIIKADKRIQELFDENMVLSGEVERLTVENAEKDAEIERVREHNITLEQKLMLLGIDDVYVFKAKAKGE